MNIRQCKKFLKKQISNLKNDNDLMRRIITDSQEMQELYDLYNKPIFVKHTTMQFQEYRAKRRIPFYMDGNGVIEHIKQVVAKDLFEGIKENITYDVNIVPQMAEVTAHIFIGIK